MWKYFKNFCEMELKVFPHENVENPCIQQSLSWKTLQSNLSIILSSHSFTVLYFVNMWRVCSMHVCMYVQSREQKKVPSLDHPPNALNSQDWLELKPRAILNSGLSRGWQELTHLGHQSCLPESTLTGNWNQTPELGFKAGTPMWVRGILHQHLNPTGYMLAFMSPFIQSIWQMYRCLLFLSSLV